MNDVHVGNKTAECLPLNSQMWHFRK